MPRALVIDDHELVRHGIRALLQDSFEVAEATNGSEALDILRTQRWDLVVLDLSLPDRAGLELLRDIKRLSADLPVLVCSGHNETEYVIRALRSGAAGYVPKSAGADQLMIAVNRAMQGKRYIPPLVAERLAEELIEGDASALVHDRLSERELEVLCLVASGKSNHDVAEMLFISVKTVSTHRTNVLRKLGLHNNAELILYAIRNHLVS